MWLFAILIILVKGIPWWLLIIGSIMLLNGILTRYDTRNDINPRGFSLIVAGLIVLLPSGIIFGNRIVKSVQQKIEINNNIYHQLCWGSVKDLERLLKEGADVEGEYPSKTNFTMLGEIVWHSDYPDAAEKIALLIEYGANVNTVMCCKCSSYDHDNNIHSDLCSATPLLFACDRANYDVLKLLIDNGGDVNFVDYYGYSALDIVEKNINDTKRKTPEDIEIFKQMKELLTESGAKNAITDPDAIQDKKGRY